MTKKEILKILDEHADKNYGDIYTNQHQEIAKDLLKYFKKQLLIQRVSNCGGAIPYDSLSDSFKKSIDSIEDKLNK